MNVTAEGIETEEQLAWLKALACESGQGYYFDRPLPPAEAGAALLARKWRA
jgi:EAL domain-containing protein (putative c-di-GMP-specific phosphodiesterase class I)